MARSPCSWRVPAVLAKLDREMSGLVGYARVSTRDQDYDGQIVELKAAGFTRIPLRAARISAGKVLILLGIWRGASFA